MLIQCLHMSTKCFINNSCRFQLFVILPLGGRWLFKIRKFYVMVDNTLILAFHFMDRLFSLIILEQKHTLRKQQQQQQQQQTATATTTTTTTILVKVSSKSKVTVKGKDTCY